MTNLDEARRLADAAEDAIREAYIDDGYPWSFSECLVLAHAFKELDKECERLKLELEDKQFCKEGLWYCRVGEELARKLQAAEAQLRAPVVGEVGALIKRLEGYDPPDRVVNEHRQLAQDVQDAAAMLRQLARAQKGQP